MTTREHEEYSENVGAYLLGALTEVEVEAFERHLEACPDCREEVEQLRVAAQALPRSVEPLEPPPALKASLMETVWSDAEATEERRPARERRRWRFPRLPRITPALAGVAAASLLALGVALGIGLGGGDDERTVAANVAIPQASGNLVVDEDGEGTLRLEGMPQPPAGQVMQVWLDRDGKVVPSTVFAVRADGTAAAAIPEDLDDVSRVMATQEPAGGSERPSQNPPPVVVEL